MLNFNYKFLDFFSSSVHSQQKALKDQKFSVAAGGHNKMDTGFKIDIYGICENCNTYQNMSRIIRYTMYTMVP